MLRAFQMTLVYPDSNILNGLTKAVLVLNLTENEDWNDRS